MAVEMILILQVICAFLFAVGALFILIDLRTNFDRSFRFFGVSLILLCSMTAIDLWVMPLLVEPSRLLFWQKLYHILSCLFVPFSIWYLLILTSSRYLKLMPVVSAISFLISSLFLTENMLHISEGTYRGGVLYNVFFLPFIFLYVIFSNYIIINKLIRSQAAERRILVFHLVGFVGLCVCGILDIADVTNIFVSTLPSFTILGVLGYGLMASLIFTERFLMLLNERENTFKKLESAYKDLEQVNALKQLGESTAIINHEIKNYMFMISGNAQLLQEIEVLSQKGKAIAKNIVTTVERLAYFSDDILKLSKTQILKEKHPVNISEVIKGTIEKHFTSKWKAFTLINLDQDHFLYGDWGKLEQVFVNAIKNSFEAYGSEPIEIRIKITTNKNVFVVSIEDNGLGCDREQLEGIFKAFYTTKKSNGGTGLGMSITRTIVESHGGKISAYSKNLVRSGEHGLKLVMTFPSFASNVVEDSMKKYPIVLIKDGMGNLQDLIRVFQNITITPYIIQFADDLNEIDFPPHAMTVLVSAETMAQKFKQLSGYPKLCLVSNHEKNLYILDQGRGTRPEIFSEEYVLNKMIYNREIGRRVKLKERQHQIQA
jgi:signal transduction histidine kinase